MFCVLRYFVETFSTIVWHLHDYCYSFDLASLSFPGPFVHQYDACSALLPSCCKLHGVPVSQLLLDGLDLSLNPCEPEAGEEEQRWAGGEERTRSIINLFCAQC